MSHSHARPPIPRLRLLLIAFGLLVFFALAIEVQTGGPVTALDADVAQFLHDHAPDSVIRVCKPLTALGNAGVWIASLGTAAYLIGRQEWRLFALGLATIGGGQLLVDTLKALFARERPVWTNPVVIEPTFAFPSGHATMSLIAFGLLTYLIWRALPAWQVCLRRACLRRARAALTVGVALLVATIGGTRLVLGVHYVSDVLAGYALGGAWLGLWISVIDLYWTGYARPEETEP